MKRPLRNIASLFAGDVASRGVGFLVTVYLARVLEPAGFGLVSVGMALLGHLQMLSSPGVQLVETRNAARPGGMDARRFGGVLTLRLVLSAMLFVTAAVVLFSIPYDPAFRAVVLWSLASLFPLAVATDWYLQGHERMGPVALARFVGYCFYGLVAWMLVRSTDDVTMAPAAFFLGSIVTSGMLWNAAVSRRSPLRLTWDRKLWVQVLRENIAVGGAMFVGQMVINLPPVVIAATWSTADAGLYNAAMKLVFLLLIADRVLNAILLPALTRVRNTKPAELENLVTITTKLVLAGIVCIILLGNLLAPWGVHLVYGQAYEGAGLVFRILLLYVGLTLINSVASNVLLAAGQERVYSGILVRGSLVLVVAMVVLTPLFGIVGTAAGAVIGELVTVILMARRARSEGLFPRIGVIAAPLLAGSVAAAAGWMTWPVSGFLSVGATGVIFIGLLILFRVFKSEDFVYMKDRLV